MQPNAHACRQGCPGLPHSLKLLTLSHAFPAGQAIHQWLHAGAPFAATLTRVSHLLQALSYQYQCSLECINENLPQIDISLVVKQGRLQYEPPLEEVHVVHYKNHLKPLLAIPLNFKVMA